MGRVKGTVSLLFPHPRLLEMQRDLWRREEHGIINKCSEKARISVSLLFIDIDCYSLTSTDIGWWQFLWNFLNGAPLCLLSHWEKFSLAPRPQNLKGKIIHVLKNTIAPST